MASRQKKEPQSNKVFSLSLANEKLVAMVSHKDLLIIGTEKDVYVIGEERQIRRVFPDKQVVSKANIER